MALQSLLNLAAGWLRYGFVEQAMTILNEARSELLNPHATQYEIKDYVSLARSYVKSSGQCSTDDGLARIIELFRKMDKTKINNTWTGSQSYSRFHVVLVEDVIHTLVSDDFSLSTSARRLLDEDEYLVRRRIHADMKREREKSGF
jgi:hypothetical protein